MLQGQDQAGWQEGFDSKGYSFRAVVVGVLSYNPSTCMLRRKDLCAVNLPSSYASKIVKSWATNEWHTGRVDIG